MINNNQFMSDQQRPFRRQSQTGIAFVLQANDSPNYRAVVPSGELGTFPSVVRAFEAIFEELESGSIYTGPGRYRLESPLSIPGGFRVSNTADGMFVNGLSDSETKCIEFAPNTGSDYLKVDCGKMDGVLLGEKNVGNDIDIWYADIHRAGVNAPSQHALKIQGSGVKLIHVNIYQGTKGILLEKAYDVHILSSIVTNSGVGLQISGAENCFFDQMDFDSCRNSAVRMDDASGIRLRGHVWNNPEFNARPDPSVEIGTNSSCDNIFTEMSQMSNTGSALHVDEVEASHLRHHINEADRSSYSYKSGITTTKRTADSCFIEGYVAPAVTDAVTNIRGGTFQLEGAGTDNGTHTASGDGSKTVFRIPHSLGAKPERTTVQPRSRDAAENFYVSQVNSSAITVEYTSAPGGGTGNLEWFFDVSV